MSNNHCSQVWNYLNNKNGTSKLKLKERITTLQRREAADITILKDKENFRDQESFLPVQPRVFSIHVAQHHVYQLLFKVIKLHALSWYHDIKSPSRGNDLARRSRAQIEDNTNTGGR